MSLDKLKQESFLNNPYKITLKGVAQSDDTFYLFETHGKLIGLFVDKNNNYEVYDNLTEADLIKIIAEKSFVTFAIFDKPLILNFADNLNNNIFHLIKETIFDLRTLKYVETPKDILVPTEDTLYKMVEEHCGKEIFVDSIFHPEKLKENSSLSLEEVLRMTKKTGAHSSEEEGEDGVSDGISNMERIKTIDDETR